MTKFESISLIVGVATGAVAAITFVTTSIRDYNLSVDAEKRNWAKASIIGVFEGEDQLSRSDLFKEFSSIVLDGGRNDMTEDELDLALLELLETDVVAYNSERNYFLKREAFFESEEKESQQQKDVLQSAFQSVTGTDREQTQSYLPPKNDSFEVALELEARIMHVFQNRNGALNRDELAAQVDRYFTHSISEQLYSFSDYSRQISNMLEVEKFYFSEEGQLYLFDPISLKPFEYVQPNQAELEANSTIDQP